MLISNVTVCQIILILLDIAEHTVLRKTFPRDFKSCQSFIFLESEKTPNEDVKTLPLRLLTFFLNGPAL